MLGAELRQGRLRIAGDHDVANLRIACESAFEKSDAFRALAGARKGNPEIFAARAVESDPTGRAAFAGWAPSRTPAAAAWPAWTATVEVSGLTRGRPLEADRKYNDLTDTTSR